jgi:hypothetical protein
MRGGNIKSKAWRLDPRLISAVFMHLSFETFSKRADNSLFVDVFSQRFFPVKNTPPQAKMGQLSSRKNIAVN